MKCSARASQKGLLVALASLLLAACTATSVDEYRKTGYSDIVLSGKESVVLLGRRHLGDYETEPEFIDCIGKRLSDGVDVNVVPELEFIDELYPWFEPRTAPLKLRRMEVLMSDPLIAAKVRDFGIQYMIWVDGNTETTDSQGSLSCTIGPGGGGCFGFASWEKLSDYEAIIWDVNKMQEKGRVRVEAEGTSYLVAVVAPVPFIARVQSEACEGIGNQLTAFFDGKEPEQE